MKNVSEYGYAKLNLCLNIRGVENGYHMLDSLCCTINIRDTVSVTKRNDGLIKAFEKRWLFLKPLEDNNNVYKAAELFKNTFSTCGFNLILDKKIPIGSGMGGSSADIAATLLALKKAFEIDCDLKPLADSLGSDSGYLLTGGFARLEGRGDIVTPKEITKKLYFVIVTPKDGVNTKECFAKYDEIGHIQPKFSVDDLVYALNDDSLKQEMFFNALYESACKINPEVRIAYESIKSLSPKAVSMSGSGSSVFGVFDSLELCDWAETKLKRKFKNVFSTESLNVSQLEKAKTEGKCLYNIEN